MRKIGLALSGGGYRAAAYHLGTIKKLKELGILRDIDVISSVSGGSITSGLYGLYGENFEIFEERLIKGVKRNIVNSIFKSRIFLSLAVAFVLILALTVYLLFTPVAWMSTPVILLFLILFIRHQFKLLPLSKILENLYDQFFFDHRKLSDLASRPILAINSTNLETARQFTFSKGYMGDSTYEYGELGAKKIEFAGDTFPLARAVAASSCVPFAFVPISISKKYFSNPEDTNLISPKLVDGAVYDNQGIHKLTQRKSKYGCQIIIVSDADTEIEGSGKYRNTLELLMKTSDIFMKRIKNIQLMKDVYENYQFEKRDIAYQSLSWDVEKCVPSFIENLKKGLVLEETIKAHGISENDMENKQWDKIEETVKSSIDYQKILDSAPTSKELKIARSVHTSLKSLSADQINALIKQASCMTEIQIRLYCPSLIA